MPWNWQLPKWPIFKYDCDSVTQQEKQFLLRVGSGSAFLKTIGKEERNQFVIEILSLEGLESSKIEGEILERESLQSSIKKQLGLQFSKKKKPGDKEEGMAMVLCSVYDSFKQPLSHEMLWGWHKALFKGQRHLEDYGQYRTHPEPMQIVSNRYGASKIYFEAPPSKHVPEEMERFIKWFNDSKNQGSTLGRAAIAHVYFESIHPFEDGNGRIGRLLIEKVLSQEVGRPVLIAISNVLERKRKEYYASLERCNRTLDIQGWIEFFAQVVLESQKQSIDLLHFLIKKSKMLTALSGKLNERQEKVLLRMFAAGLEGFKGSLSAEKYITITKTSRATATRDLADLVEKGVLIKTGELRHSRYWLTI